MTDTTLKPAPTPRPFLLWIDGVGGFQVCLARRLSVGQAAGGNTPDLAILANIARHHVTLQRDLEGYFLEALGETSLDGRRVDKAFPRSGDRLLLGSACQLVFTLPVPLSASARLDLTSGHRWLKPVQAALLMAETLVIGPGPQAHVPVEDMNEPLILFRGPAGLAAHYAGNLSIGGQTYKERGPVAPGNQVMADVLSLSMEWVE